MTHQWNDDPIHILMNLSIKIFAILIPLPNLAHATVISKLTGKRLLSPSFSVRQMSINAENEEKNDPGDDPLAKHCCDLVEELRNDTKTELSKIDQRIDQLTQRVSAVESEIYKRTESKVAESEAMPILTPMPAFGIVVIGTVMIFLLALLIYLIAMKFGVRTPKQKSKMSKGKCYPKVEVPRKLLITHA
ncbi:hypothetical protein DdX_13801 [Ditylenchus destructor]|uniref:Uncharacterized protein n=1 Tax=Ditylenchus destructor TaxID=166010 RepID=A0AAD4R2G5_9BILA|nr:hypothetical protein DdX_13801 [Ditylenchus destructor]